MNQEYLNVQLNKLVNNLEKSLEQIDFIEELNELEGGGTGVNTVPRAVNIGPPAAAQTTTRNVTPVVAQTTTRNVIPVVAQTTTRNVIPVVAQTTTRNVTPAVDHMSEIRESLRLIKQGAQTSISAKEIDQEKFDAVVNELGGLKIALNDILKKALEIQTGVDIIDHNKDIDNAHKAIDSVTDELGELKKLFDQQGGSNELVNLEYNL